jgi:alkanesulfonate monooxygenase SsuD/methylene tetrahydromethanopterin reductase-like flavin-dependent oxidoreductase (luciferase family)
MDETRARFDESAKMIIKALETGYIEGDDPHFPQLRTKIKPKPTQNAKDRLYGVAMSPESAQVMGELGARMMCFVQFDMAMHLPNIERYRSAFTQQHRRPAPPPVLLDFCYCDKDVGKAKDRVRKYLAVNYLSILQHYEFMADYHKEIKGYEAYGKSAEFLNSLGREEAVEDYSKPPGLGPGARRSKFSTSSKPGAVLSATTNGTPLSATVACPLILWKAVCV